MAAISGWGGRVRIGGAAGRSLPVGRWSATERMDPVEATTMEGVGQGTYAAGVTDWDVSFDCFWDTTIETILSNEPSVIPGTSAKDYLNASTKVVLELFLDRASATRKWIFQDGVLITNVTMDDEVRGVVRYTVTGIASRPVTFGGAAPTVNAGPARPYV